MIEDSPAGKKLYGFYRGKVLKHLSNGKCKIWIPSVYSEQYSSLEKADCLPDAEQASPLAFGSNEGNGFFSYPHIGAIVWCFFQNGDQNYPVYFAATLGGENAVTQIVKKESSKGGTEDAIVIGNWDKARAVPAQDQIAKDKKPFNDSPSHVIQAKNTIITIYECGILTAKTTGSNASCTLTIDQEGNAVLDTDAKVCIMSKQVSIDAETQIDLTSKQIAIDAETECSIKSPAIFLNAANGHIDLKTRVTEKVV